MDPLFARPFWFSRPMNVQALLWSPKSHDGHREHPQSTHVYILTFIYLYLKYQISQCCVEHQTARYSLVPARKIVRSCSLEVRKCHFLCARARSRLESDTRKCSPNIKLLPYYVFCLLGGIHKPYGRNFGHFDPPPPSWTDMVFWPTPLENHVEFLRTPPPFWDNIFLIFCKKYEMTHDINLR